MSSQITTAYVKQFTEGITLLAQQKDSRLRNAVRVEPIEGDRAFFDQVGISSMTKRTSRHAETNLTDTAHTRRMVTSDTYDKADMIDKHDDQDAGRLTPAQQDQVVDECFQCKLCYVNCPYIPELHDWNLDFPRLMLRADAMQSANGLKSARDKATTQMMGRTDLLGMVATRTSPVANKVITAKPGSTLKTW